MWSSTNEGQNKGCLDEAIGPIMEMVNDELFSNLMEEKKVAAIVKKTAEASKTVSYNMLELLASRMSKASIGPMLTQLLGKLLKNLYGFYCVVRIFCVCSTYTISILQQGILAENRGNNMYIIKFHSCQPII